MKRLLFYYALKKYAFICMALLFSVIPVQGRDFNGEKGVYAEMGAGFDNTGVAGTFGYISPEVGFKLNRLLSFGVTSRFDFGKSYESGSYNSYGGFVELSTGSFHGLSGFVDVMATHNRHCNNRGVFGCDDFTEIGLTPGIRYSLPWYGLSLSVRYAFIGFSDNWELLSKHDRAGFYSDGKLLVDGRFRRLEFAVRYTFGL